MKFDLMSVVMNPFFLIFLTLCVGMGAGNMKKLGKMRLGVGGPLFFGLAIGWVVKKLAFSVKEGEPGYDAASSLIKTNAIPSILLSVMLILFVAAVGLLASRDLGVVIKRYGLRFIALGLFITLIGAGLSYTTVLINSDTDAFEASGIYTGALTSSPGLGAAMETAAKYASAAAGSRGMNNMESTHYINKALGKVGTGHAVAYPFGMIIVIIAMTLLPKIFKLNLPSEFARYQSETAGIRKISGSKPIEPVMFDIKSYAFVCLTGYVSGMVEIYLGPLGYFSLGSIGGVLISSVVLGYIGKLGPFTFKMDNRILSTVKDISLSCYVGMVGINYGHDVIEALTGNGIYYAAVSALIALLCVTTGFLFGRYVLGINWVMLSGAICGGMTSTPGLGMAVDVIGTDEPAAGYAAAYPAALTGMVLFTITMYNISPV